MGTLSFIQVAADSVGKKVRTFLGGDGNHAEAAVLIDTEGVQQGTAAAPVRTDPTGTTPQPVTATNLDVALSTRTKPADQQHVIVDTMTPTLALDATVAGRLKPADTLTGVTTVAAVTAITNALPAGTNRLGSVRPVDSADADLTAAKGTQTARALGTQDLKDSGRQAVMLSWEEMAGTAAAESALTTFTRGSLTAAALTAASSYTVTAAKRLRIQSITLYLKSTSTVAVLARYRIRQAASAISNASPVIFDAVVGLDAATFASGQADELAIPIPDGLEVAATQQITFTWFTSVNTCTVGLAIVGYEY